MAVLLAVATVSARQAAQAPPDTEIYLASLKMIDGAIELGAPVNITNNPGYDNQPFFTADGKGILFASVRGAAPGGAEGSLTRTDIYRYDIASRATARVTETAEGEYSPTAMLDGTRVSVIRVEADGTQRLASIAPNGAKIQVDVILPDIKPVGYHAWADERTVAMFVLGGNGQPATLQVGDTTTGTARTLASDIGRSIQRIPGTGARAEISFVQRERDGQTVRLLVKKLNPATGAITTLTPAVDGSREADLAWTPDGTLLMAKDGMLYGWKPGRTGWREAASLQKLSLGAVTRIAVSPSGDSIALVASPREPR